MPIVQPRLGPAGGAGSPGQPAVREASCAADSLAATALRGMETQSPGPVLWKLSYQGGTDQRFGRGVICVGSDLEKVNVFYWYLKVGD